jgi:excisionase family DNA binding protein
MLREPMLTVHDAAAKLQIAEETVRGLIRDKQLRAIKIGKEWRIATVDLLEFLNANANRPGGGPASQQD